MHIKYIIIFASLIISSSTVFANIIDNEDYIKTNRYSDRLIAPTKDQQSLLSVIIQLRFPKDIQKIGQAINYLLKNSGYQLGKVHIDDSQYFLYELPLPEAHRQLGPITLKSALQILGNSGFDLVINPVKRTVSYKLSKNFSEYLDTQDIENAKARWEKTNLHNRNLKNKNSAANLLQPKRQYGLVKRGESLSSIALNLNIKGISMSQVIVALYQENQEAFLYQNMNLILEGVMLNIPKMKSIESIPYRFAKEQIREHHNKWKKLLSSKVKK